jgi:hypothetical protein
MHSCTAHRHCGNLEANFIMVKETDHTKYMHLIKHIFHDYVYITFVRNFFS